MAEEGLSGRVARVVGQEGFVAGNHLLIRLGVLSNDLGTVAFEPRDLEDAVQALLAHDIAHTDEIAVLGRHLDRQVVATAAIFVFSATFLAVLCQKFPSISEIVPFVVPFSTIVAPIKDSLLPSSVTVPVI